MMLIKSSDDQHTINGGRTWQKLSKDAEGLDDTLKDVLIREVMYPAKIKRVEDI